MEEHTDVKELYHKLKHINTEITAVIAEVLHSGLLKLTMKFATCDILLYISCK